MTFMQFVIESQNAIQIICEVAGAVTIATLAMAFIEKIK